MKDIKGNNVLAIITIIGLLIMGFAILFVIGTNRAQHVDSLSNILSSIVSGLLGALGGGAIVAHMNKQNVTADQVNVTSEEKE